MKDRDIDAPATDFAITSVNVPDRLDVLDMRWGKGDDDDPEPPRRRRRGAGRLWFARIGVVAALCLSGFAALEAVDAWKAQLSADELSRRLTQSLGVPVHVGESRISLLPQPHLGLERVDIGGVVTIPEVSLALPVRDLGELVAARGWHWGEALIAPMSMTLAQGRFLLELLPRFDGALPGNLGTLRCVRFVLSDFPGGAEPWDAAARRDPAGHFEAVTLERGSDRGFLRLTIGSPPQSSAGGTGEGAVPFQIDGANTRLPFGPGSLLGQVTGKGTLESDRLTVQTLSIAQPFGGLRAHLDASRTGANGGWAVAGTIESGSADLQELLGPQRPASGDGASAALVQGLASVSGTVSGQGGTLDEAARNAVFAGRFTVHDGVINGVDLGYAATHSDALDGAGGSTPFAAATGELVIGPKGIVLRDIRAHAGALAVVGEAAVSDGRHVTGGLYADLIDAMRAQAPVHVALGGTLGQPVFGK